MAKMRIKLDELANPDEKKVYKILETKLSDDYHVWPNFNFHKVGREIDFVILHPLDGIYVLEVKGWLKQNINFNSEGKLQFVNSKGEKSIQSNPLDQVKFNSQQILAELIKKVEFQQDSSDHKGKLIFPVSYGVVFTNIRAEEIEKNNWSEKFPLNSILDKGFANGDYFHDSDYEYSLKQLRKLTFTNPRGLTNKQWEIISSFFGTTIIQSVNDDAVIGVLDEFQEELVRYEITKTVIFEGPAGSGKSIVLVNRAAFIHEQNPNSKIGVFCFNVVMANMLRSLLNKREFNDNIEVHHFDSSYIDKFPEKHFDALLIDEAQDMEDKHFNKIFDLLKTESLSIFYDPKQNIYNRSSLQFLLEGHGIVAEYTKKLIRQQRSPLLLLAQIMYDSIMQFEEEDCDIYIDNIDQVIEKVISQAPQYFESASDPISSIATGAARHFTIEGQELSELTLTEMLSLRIDIKEMKYVKDIIKDIIETIKVFVDVKIATYNDFAIIFPWSELNNGYRMEGIPYWAQRLFEKEKIPIRIINAEKGRVIQAPEFEEIMENDNREFDFEDDVVRCTTINQFKGLDAKYIAIVGFENITNRIENNLHTDFESDKKKSASLAYAGLTRATEQCWIYYIKSNKSIEILEHVLESEHLVFS